MNYRLMFTITAVVLALFGVGFLVFPDAAFAQLGTETYVIVNYLSRFFGGALLLLAWFLWLLKDIANMKAQKTIAISLFGFSLAGFALIIMGMSRQSIGVIRANGWVLLVIYGLFALIYGYMLFLRPKEQKQRASSKRPKDSEFPAKMV